MVDADHLRIVFRMNGVDFIMPVADLLAIRGLEEEGLTPQVQAHDPLQPGYLSYCGTDVQVYDLASLFNLTGEKQTGEGRLLIFAGSDGPWAVRVDCVDGVTDAAKFAYQDLPAYMFDDEFVPYHQVALYEGRLLVSLEARQMDRAWCRSA